MATRTTAESGTGKPFVVPAPFLGFNSRESYSSLQPTEARILENWLPDEGAVKQRPGRILHQAVGLSSSVPTLTKWKGATGEKLIAGASGTIFDVSGVATPISATGYANSRWSTANFNGFLFGVNGVSDPWRYNGTTFGATGFVSASPLTSFQTISQVRNRLWVTKNNSADVEYGPIGGVTGDMTVFQLSQIASGGKCMGIGSWSRDAGDGSDDFTVFVMNTGEVIVYQGDPGTSFALVGKYAAPAPIGKDFLVKVGGELVVMTTSGPIPVSAVVAGNAFSFDALQTWGKVAPAWRTDYSLYGSNPGWNAYFFDGIVYFNVATGVSSTKQYVLNTRTNAWTTYGNMPASMFADYLGSLYFGGYSNGSVWRHAGGTDDGAQIITLARQGASYPGGASRAKQFTMFMPLMDMAGPTQFQFSLDVDFLDAALGTSVFDLSTSGSGAAWGDPWGTAWGSSGRSLRRWYSAKGYGRAVAPVIRTLSVADSVSWFASQIIAVPGGMT